MNIFATTFKLAAAIGPKSYSRAVIGRGFISGAVLKNKLTHTPIKETKPPMTVDVELPDPQAQSRKYKYQFAAFVTVVTVSFILIVNYEKTASPIIGSTLHFLRRSDKVKQLLGNHVDFQNKIFPWVWGELNQVKGRINISFKIQGDNGKVGTVILIADRPNKRTPLTIHQWSVVVDGTVHDILHDDTVGFSF